MTHFVKGPLAARLEAFGSHQQVSGIFLTEYLTSSPFRIGRFLSIVYKCAQIASRVTRSQSNSVHMTCGGTRDP